MSSSGSKGNGLSHTANGGIHGLMILSGEQSVSEAISNISSPDYQDEHDLLSTRDLSAAMAISDPSDSDSTLIIDNLQHERDHKVVIQVAATEANKSGDTLKDSEDELATLTEDPMTIVIGNARESSPPISDDGSDVDSLHSFHYSPKAVDIPSAVRLAKRLYTLDGFKKSDVSRHLSKK
jgi:PH/SEC7 domain-containing protein